MDDPDTGKTINTHTSCPHCGHQLSQWEQILLNVDRALMCKNCWYRITLKAYDDGKEQAPPTTAPQGKKSNDER